ncbi:SPASM domain-containing protein [Aquihabitans sp. G128]|nr:SPASM domain-containing protein [Aquihabitans sp. G128]
MRTKIFARRAPTAPPLSSACYAPHSALYFEPNGTVQACCATGFHLGQVSGPARQSLRDIWEGANTAAQRAALEAGQLRVRLPGVRDRRSGRRPGGDHGVALRSLCHGRPAPVPADDGLRPVQPLQPAVHHVQRRPLVDHPGQARGPAAAARRLRRPVLRRARGVPPAPRPGPVQGRRAVPRARTAASGTSSWTTASAPRSPSPPTAPSTTRTSSATSASSRRTPSSRSTACRPRRWSRSASASTPPPSGATSTASRRSARRAARASRSASA